MNTRPTGTLVRFRDRLLVCGDAVADFEPVTLKIPLNAPRYVRAQILRSELVVILEGKDHPRRPWEEIDRQVLIPSRDVPRGTNF